MKELEGRCWKLEREREIAAATPNTSVLAAEMSTLSTASPMAAQPPSSLPRKGDRVISHWYASQARCSLRARLSVCVCWEQCKVVVQHSVPVFDSVLCLFCCGTAGKSGSSTLRASPTLIETTSPSLLISMTATKPLACRYVRVLCVCTRVVCVCVRTRVCCVDLCVQAHFSLSLSLFVHFAHTQLPSLPHTIRCS